MTEDQAWQEWLNVAVPDSDPEVQAICNFDLQAFRQDPGPRQLVNIVAGDNYRVVAEVMALRNNADETAAELERQWPNCRTRIQGIDRLHNGRVAAKVTAMIRRPNIFELARDGRLNRRWIAGQIEGNARDSKPGATLAELERWRVLIRSLLMYGKPRKPDVTANPERKEAVNG